MANMAVDDEEKQRKRDERDDLPQHLPCFHALLPPLFQACPSKLAGVRERARARACVHVHVRARRGARAQSCAVLHMPTHHHTHTPRLASPPPEYSRDRVRPQEIRPEEWAAETPDDGHVLMIPMGRLGNLLPTKRPSDAAFIEASSPNLCATHTACMQTCMAHPFVHKRARPLGYCTYARAHTCAHVYADVQGGEGEDPAVAAGSGAAVHPWAILTPCDARYGLANELFHCAWRCYLLECGPVSNNFSAHADDKRRGLDRIEGWRRKGLGKTRLLGAFSGHGSSMFAVGMLRDIEKKPPSARVEWAWRSC